MKKSETNGKIKKYEKSVIFDDFFENQEGPLFFLSQVIFANKNGCRCVV